MKINAFTIVLNGQPWIERVARSLLRVPGARWTVVHGVANPVADTSWCKPIDAPEDDGTLKFLRWLRDRRPDLLTLIEQPHWPGKTAMCNAALDAFTEPGLLMQIDADEIWQPEQLRVMPSLFAQHPSADAAMFLCRYWVGPRRYVCTPNAYGNNCGYEWIRAWKFAPGQRFLSHEPPMLDGAHRYVSHSATAHLGLVFDHYAYATRDQVAFKEQYYGYAGAVAAWEKLNAATGPQDVSAFLPWVKTPVISYEA